MVHVFSSIGVQVSHRTGCGVAVPLWDFEAVFKIRFCFCHTEGIIACVDIMVYHVMIVLFHCKVDLH